MILQILDLSERVTRILSKGTKYSAGRHALNWGGKDDGGQPVAGGVCFVQLRASDHLYTQKILMPR